MSFIFIWNKGMKCDTSSPLFQFKKSFKSYWVLIQRPNASRVSDLVPFRASTNKPSRLGSCESRHLGVQNLMVCVMPFRGQFGGVWTRVGSTYVWEWHPTFFFCWDFGLDLWPRTIWSCTIYAPGPYGPVLFIILKNILSQICSRTISEKHTAPGAYSKHAPGAVCILDMVLEHIWLKKFFQIINGPGQNGPEPYGPGP